MTTPINAHQSLARRVALMAVAMLAVVLAVISLTLAFVSASSSRDRIVTAASDKASALADSIDAFDATARMMTDRAYRPFRKKFADAFELDAESGMLKSWGMLLNGDTGEVDSFNQSNGGVATIFMRKGDDFERITTSLKKEDGERAVGTLLSRDHPAYARMLAGGEFTGRATLFGKPYMTHYEAVKDGAGQVVGILFIGFDITDMQLNLSKLVDEARFYTTGATTVIDPRKDNADAIFVVHPTAAGKKVLEVYPDAGPMLTALRSPSEGFFDGAPKMFSADMTHPWVVKREAKSSGWWIVAELSDDEAMATYWKTIYAFWALLGVATLILGVGLYWLVNRSVSRPLADLTSAVTSVAQGDLTQTFHSNRQDEIGGLVREVEHLRQRFQKMLRDMRSAADSINTASAEIATGNQDLSARTEQTASNLQQTASSMEQLTSTVKNSADAARQANQLASSASEVAVRGGQVVGQVVSTMQEIHHSSQKISDIIGVIDGIAFQTNILALNAAVEAARAGEQGRGFAVVAGEVRNLAQRSAEAAKEIKGLIGTSVDKVEAGSRLVADAGQTMSEIVGSIQRVTDIVGEISAAAGEQSDGIGQVNTAVNQLDQMTQQNAALVEESAAAAESLKDQASRLAQAVAVYRIDQGSDGPIAVSSLERPKAASTRPQPSPPITVEPSSAKAETTEVEVAPRPSPVVNSIKPPNKLPSATSAASPTEGDWESF